VGEGTKKRSNTPILAKNSMFNCRAASPSIELSNNDPFVFSYSFKQFRDSDNDRKGDKDIYFSYKVFLEILYT
jgi:hypothetical protein